MGMGGGGDGGGDSVVMVVLPSSGRHKPGSDRRGSPFTSPSRVICGFHARPLPTSHAPPGRNSIIKEHKGRTSSPVYWLHKFYYVYLYLSFFLSFY